MKNEGSHPCGVDWEAAESVYLRNSNTSHPRWIKGYLGDPDRESQGAWSCAYLPSVYLAYIPTRHFIST